MDPQDTSTDDHSTSVIQSRQIYHQDSKQSSSFLKSKRKTNIFDSFSHNNNDTQESSMLESLNNKKTDLSSQLIDLMQTQKNNKRQKLKQVFVLQQYLQKQYLMLVKQQSQKSKFIKQIQDQMKNYYSLLIQTKDKVKSKESNEGKGKQDVLKKGFQFLGAKKPVNKIVTDDGFDNCSNFIKQIVIHTSRNYEVATILLMNCTITYDQNQKESIFIKDYLMLIDLFVNVLYERVSETDPFLKEITKLVCQLLARLPKLRDDQHQLLVAENINNNNKGNQLNLIKTNYQKVQQVFRTYIQKQQIQDYFETISNNILKKIQKISFYRAQNRSRAGISLHQSKSIITQNSFDLLDKQFTDPTSSFGFDLNENWMEYVRPHQSFNEQKRALAMSFLSQVYSEADLCPIGLKIVLKYFYQKQSQYYTEKYPQITKSQLKQLTSLRLWQLIQSQYINKLTYQKNKQNILFKQMSTLQLEIIDDIKNIVMGFFNCKNTSGYLSDEQLIDGYRKSKKFISKVVEKLLSFNQEKYCQFLSGIKEKELQIIQLSMKKVKSEISNKKKEKDKNVEQSEIVGMTGQSFFSQSTLMENLNRQQNNQEKQKQQKQTTLPPQLLRIYGGCISFKQLQILLQSLRRLLPFIPNQRIINRTQRIFDMSPQLQFLTKHKLVKHPNQIQFMYIILLQHQLNQLISNDYRVLYGKQYEGDKVKSMIRQIICQLKLKQLSKRVNKRDIVNKKKVNKSQFQLQDLKMFKKGSVKLSPQKSKQNSTQQNRLLINLLQKISDQCSKSVEGTQVEYSLHKGISLQLLKKIKYLLYMSKNKSSQLNESQILQEMLIQVKSRSEKMRRIYEHTKFGLLAAIGNIKHYKNLLISKKQIQLKIESRVNKIQLLENVHFYLCITSPYTRSHPEFGLKHSQGFSNENQGSSFSSSRSPQKYPSNQSPTKMLSSSFTKLKQTLPQKFEQIKNPKQSTVFFQPFNKYKYRISNADDIVICATDDCIHKDNIFMGLSYHLNSIKQFIQMFSALRQVSENMFFANFIIPETLSLQIQKKLTLELKNFISINHPLLNVFLSKKYQKLNYSIDKINTTFYQFIDYIMQDKIPQVSPQSTTNKYEMTEIRKVLKDILLRGLHSHLVKKIENQIKVNLIQDNNKKVNNSKTTKQQSNKIRCLINHGLDAPNSSPHILTNFINNEEDGEQNGIQESQLVRDVSNSKKQSVSQEIHVFVEQVKSPLLKRWREIPRHMRETGNKQGNHNRIDSQRNQQQTDNSVYQSRNDQILLYQIQRIHNSKRFQSFNHFHHNKITEHSQQISNVVLQSIEISVGKDNNTPSQSLNMKQLEQVCARYIKAINKKETPQDKIQQLKQISQIYKLVVRQPHCHKKHHQRVLNASRKTVDHQQFHEKSTQLQVQDYHETQQQNHYNIQKLIFRSLIIAEPPNFITNLAFIEMFLHKDKMMLNQGKILNQFKNIVKKIFQFKDIQQYLGPKLQCGNEQQQRDGDFSNDNQLKGLLKRIQNQSNKEIY